MNTQRPTLLAFTIPLDARDADAPVLTLAEASEMAAMGFRFSEFSAEGGRYRLATPYRTVHNLDRGTLTLMQ